MFIYATKLQCECHTIKLHDKSCALKVAGVTAALIHFVHSTSHLTRRLRHINRTDDVITLCARPTQLVVSRCRLDSERQSLIFTTSVGELA